jgi:hypothetical protein
LTPDKLFHVCGLFPALLSAFSIGVVVGGRLTAPRMLLSFVSPENGTTCAVTVARMLLLDAAARLNAVGRRRSLE